MKILLVTNEDPGSPVGGLSTFILGLKSGLLNLGLEVRILLIRYDNSSAQKTPASDQVDYDVWGGHRFLSSTIDGQILEAAHSVLIKALPILNEWKPDIIHCNDRQTYMPFRGLANVVFSLHLCMGDLEGMKSMTDGWFSEFKIDRYALTEAPLSVVYSRFMRQRVWNHIAPDSKPALAPLGFSGAKLQKRAKNGQIVVSYFGRFNQTQKGLKDFLDAVHLLPEDFLKEHRVTFRVHGPGALPADWPCTRLEYTRHVKGKEKHEAYMRSDIVVMPSRYEPFGLVGLEALAAGCLLLAPEGLGMDEYFEPGVNGLSIMNTPGDIAKTLIEVIQNWNKLLPLKSRAVETAKNWTWNRSAEFHARLYSNLLAPRNKTWSTCFSRSALLDRETRPVILEPINELLLYLSSPSLNLERILFVEPSEELRISLNGRWSIYSHNHDGYSDWSWLPYEETSFDLVVAFGVLEYSSRVFSVIEEWRRISKAILLGILPEGLAPQRKGSFDMPKDGKFLAPEWSCQSVDLNWELGETWLLEKQ